MNLPEKTVPDSSKDGVAHPPEWFEKALARPGESRLVSCDGHAVHYLFWPSQEKNRPVLVFVHGNGAHAHWFAFIAPFLTHRFNVACLDLPGMGDSAWRKKYVREDYAHAVAYIAFEATREVATREATPVNIRPAPVICGHSFGGFATLITGSLYGPQLGGILLADFQIRSPENSVEWFLKGPPRKATRVYDTLETALSRFRLAPPQECAQDYILDYIARHSLTEVREGTSYGRETRDRTGWSWKFDPFAFRNLRMGDDHARIYQSLPCRTAAFFGQDSKDCDPETLSLMRHLRPDAPVFTIANAQHHIMLDQPHAFATAVEAVTAGWEAQSAHPGPAPQSF